jgi:hypothetical protein
MPVNVAQLAPFLLEAKRRTYAAQGDEASVSLPLMPGFVSGNQWEDRPERFRGVGRIALAGRRVYELLYAGALLR